MHRPLFLLAALLCLTCIPTLSAQEPVKIWEAPLTLPTYRIKPPDKNPMFFRNQSYQGASRYIYPYALEDNITDEKVDKTYRAVYLENEYIKLCVLPEIGGRLFYATDKTNGYEMFYRQHVIKPANIGMLGAWISGGIEFCVFHHHRASTNIPVDFKLVENDDGSATIWIGETEPRHRMTWSLGITLYPGRSYIEVDGRLINPTPNNNSILYWANVATHVNDDYQIIFPPSTDFAVYHAKNSFTTWPITSTAYTGKAYYQDGIDASWWKNHPNPVSMFAHDLREGFLAGYDHGRQAGTMHVANPHIVKGAKLWEWGPGPYGAMWDTQVLTDNDGPYAELMTGAYSDNQPDYSWIKPYENKTFKQYWYPLRETQGAVAANLNATLNLKRLDDQRFLLAVNTTRPHSGATLTLKQGKEVVFRSDINVAPGEPFHHNIPLSNADESALTLSLEDAAGNLLIAYEPVANTEDPPLPEPVSPPLEPEEIESTEELYFTGLRLRQFHNARIAPEPYFQEALRRDPLDSRANTQMGILRKEDFALEEAAGYFRTALQRPTAHYTRPRDGEPLYQLGVVLQRQGKLDAAYDTLYRAAWDHDFASAAYFHLAQISVARKHWARARQEIDRSLDYNRANLSARNLKTTILRRMGDHQQAAAERQKVLAWDPLNAYALHEGVQLGQLDMQGLAEAMRYQPESWLELVARYLNAGLLAEARSLLEYAVRSDDDGLSRYPTLHYYLGFLYAREGHAPEANRHFRRGQELPTDYCFPFRLESIAVFRAALRHDPADARAHYYLGNLLYDKQPERAIGHWERAVSLEPALAIAHRNLGWAYRHARGDIEKAIPAYEAAIRHNPEDPRYYLELDRLYEGAGVDVEKRYRLLSQHHRYVAQRPDALMQEVKVLILRGDSHRAIEYLTGHFFPRQEGVDNLHDLFVDACLARGIAELRAGNPAAALTYFEMADTYPERHQFARDPNYPRNAQIYYYQALAREGPAARNLLERVAELPVDAPEYRYYRAMALKKLGKDQEASALAQGIEAEGHRLLSIEDQVDFFSKFGEGRSASVRQAEGHYLLALANLIRGKEDSARRHLKQAGERDPSHLWARLIR